jgi:hypothetical protein
MMLAHRIHKEQPGSSIGRPVRAHEALGSASQLLGRSRMNIDTATLAEAANARSIASVDPYRCAVRGDVDFVGGADMIHRADSDRPASARL